MTAGPTGLVIFCYKKESWEQLSLLCSIHKIKTFFWLLVTTRSLKLHLSTLWLLVSCLVWLVLLFSVRCPFFQSSSLLFAAPIFSHLLYLFVAHLCLFIPVLLAAVPLFSATFLLALDLLLSIHFPFPLFVRSKIWLASLKFEFLAHLLACI